MPTGHGHRIVKPRTAKQRAQAEAWGGAAVVTPAAEPSTVNAPDSSWWTTPHASREAFDATAKAQVERMKASTFGKGKQVVLV